MRTCRFNSEYAWTNRRFTCLQNFLIFERLLHGAEFGHFHLIRLPTFSPSPIVGWCVMPGHEVVREGGSGTPTVTHEILRLAASAVPPLARR